MSRAPTNPWLAEQVDQALVEHLTERHVPNPPSRSRWVSTSFGDPCEEDDEQRTQLGEALQAMRVASGMSSLARRS